VAPRRSKPRPNQLAFDEGRADHVQRWYERVLVHTKGRFARSPFVLTDWQRDEIIRPLFGRVRWDSQLQMWVRAHSLAWIELARKNGKSELVAGAGLYLLIADGEEEAEVYGAAKDREQAGVVYQVAKRMCELSPVLSRLIEKKQLLVIDSKKRIVFEPTGSFYQVVASDAGGNLGTNPHGILFDEIITQPSRELWDDLKTGMGTRTQPLMLAITTAGNDPFSMAAEEHRYSEQVRDDPALDPTRFVYMRNTPVEADWTDEMNWFEANPGLGDFLSIATLRAEFTEARASLSKQNTFRQFRLNQWVRQVTRWLDMLLWDANAGLVVEGQLEGRECYGGLDLSATSDFSAWVLFFPGEEEDHVISRFWIPAGALERRGAMRDMLAAWARSGDLTITDGDIIDQDVIEAQIDADARRFNIRDVGYDRWNATQLIRKLDDGGLPTTGIAQTTSELNTAARELERRLGLRRLRHGGQPVLRWMADNVELYSDSNGLIKPSKKHSKEKIDGVVALVMALKQYMAGEGGGDFAIFVDTGS
jgi:phage terminase large subunit-like protein